MSGTAEERRARRQRRVSDQLAHPARLIAFGFGFAVLTGTALLMLPAATEAGERPSFVDALFTATSSVCVTGLAIVDTGGHWSTFGEVVILLLMQIGGLGIMTMATIIALVVSRRLGLRARLLIQAETKTLQLRDVRRVLRAIIVFSLVTEAIVTAILTVRFATHYDMSWGRAAYDGVFHAVSAFNSGGLSLYSDSMSRFVRDPIVSLTVTGAVLLGSIGYLVIFELTRNWRRPREWSVLTQLTLGVSGVLVVLGTTLITVAEWSNDATFGPLDVPDKMIAGFFASVMPRSGGLNSVDIGAMREESLLLQIILMFIGGGSASTAGGIKVTTFGLLAFVIWAEMRGQAKVHVGRRQVPEANQRQALAIALLGIGLVMAGTLVLLGLTDHPFDRVLFEATSAFGTVGLSTGITPDLGRGGQLVVVALMFIGRIGPLTMASALALRERDRRYEYPEERTIVG
ncbi:TrkH family potassium uptake protein [Sporichthya sp.]|uniref:TrkH family potassium uptake protein n=1 Tax=Sporichthya sp. TaxID=65475 RepID=UPI0017FC4D00|nr:potassium transporter TrkG [Sporichthya sp.]MBA3742742.1 TrkH family potassium uptake protein [Sporichthya sp.]